MPMTFAAASEQVTEMLQVVGALNVADNSGSHAYARAIAAVDLGIHACFTPESRINQFRYINLQPSSPYLSHRRVPAFRSIFSQVFQPGSE